jgi:hypothetical protein
MSDSNPYGSVEAELRHLRLRRSQYEAADGDYAEEIAALDARIAELDA